MLNSNFLTLAVDQSIWNQLLKFFGLINAVSRGKNVHITNKCSCCSKIDQNCHCVGLSGIKNELSLQLFHCYLWLIMAVNIS